MGELLYYLAIDRSVPRVGVNDEEFPFHKLRDFAEGYVRPMEKNLYVAVLDILEEAIKRNRKPKPDERGNPTTKSPPKYYPKDTPLKYLKRCLSLFLIEDPSFWTGEFARFIDLETSGYADDFSSEA